MAIFLAGHEVRSPSSFKGLASQDPCQTYFSICILRTSDAHGVDFLFSSVELPIYDWAVLIAKPRPWLPNNPH